ncbi:isochorismate synthase [Verticiella sediminum]|uniref:isochorismate synthase n=1 Tax=Verticiella sediminum TaxID=1247510 RepID=A0A556AZG7_9BURK|nr:isochorismate synthase [Verticiella sediminum]TSH98333.1 isochorismate synthase [Verticiella sediminum]
MTPLSDDAPRPPVPDFLLDGPRHSLTVAGRKRDLPSGALPTLAERAASFFDSHPDGPRLLVGAIPYDRRADDALFQPDALVARRWTAPAASGGGTRAVRVVAEPSGAGYRAAVAEAVRRIQRGEFDKIVLSRSLRLLGEQPHAEAELLARLQRDPEATVFRVPLPARRAGERRRLLGATPELLLQRQGRQVVSHPLAGSARRHADTARDRAAGAALLASDKDRREHAMAAEMVLDALAPYCDRLSAPQGMALVSTAQMWHLGTRIEGRLRDPESSCAELLAVLHPTPAVGGMPRAAAEAALPALEGYDRGFYAGAVGWIDGAGDGCWYLALRCAELLDTEARLYAGAGIVAGSDPALEEAETSAKFLAMLATFGIDESGRSLDNAA